jgi:hypothetical protein
MDTLAARNPSRSSYYITNDFYMELISDFADWQVDERSVEDLAERDKFRRLVEQEARLLDRLLYEEWLGLYMPECAYWVPSTPEGGDPRSEIAVMFDDRRGHPVSFRTSRCSAARAMISGWYGRTSLSASSGMAKFACWPAGPATASGSMTACGRFRRSRSTC